MTCIHVLLYVSCVIPYPITCCVPRHLPSFLSSHTSRVTSCPLPCWPKVLKKSWEEGAAGSRQQKICGSVRSVTQAADALTARRGSCYTNNIILTFHDPASAAIESAMLRMRVVIKTWPHSWLSRGLRVVISTNCLPDLSRPQQVGGPHETILYSLKLFK